MIIKIETPNKAISILAEITEDQYECGVFEVETPDYLLQITSTPNTIRITNAMNGWGHNCRDDFRDAEITAYKMINS